MAHGRTCSGPTVKPVPATTRRRSLAVLAVLTVVAGLAVSRLPDPAGDVGGTVLYAALVYLLVGVAAPRLAPARIAVVALAICWAIELLQLTALPEQLAAHVPGAAYVLGTTFAPLDLLGYAAGAAAAWGIDQAWTRRRHAG